jgi:hypothetical protein
LIEGTGTLTAKRSYGPKSEYDSPSVIPFFITIVIIKEGRAKNLAITRQTFFFITIVIIKEGRAKNLAITRQTFFLLLS